MKIKKINMIEVGDWDKLVQNTYKRPYSFQQQNDCQDRGTVNITIPSQGTNDDDMHDSIPEEINGEKMGVKFEKWLARDPKEWNGKKEDAMFVGIFWERNFYPDLQTVANDLYKKGLIEAGKYTINTVGTSTKAVTIAQTLWNKAVVANPIGLLIVAVAALAAGIYLLTSRESEYSKIKKQQEATLKTHSNIRENTIKGMASEVSHLAILMTKLKDTNTSQKERTNIIKELNKNYSNLIGYQISEKASLDDLTKSYNDIIQVLYRKYQTQAVEKELIETFEKRITIQRQLNELEAGGSENIKEYIDLKKRQKELEEEANKVATTSTQKYFEYQQEISKVKDRQRELEISNNSLTASAKQQEIIDAQNIEKKKELEIQLSKVDKEINGVIGSFSDYFIEGEKTAGITEDIREEYEKLGKMVSKVSTSIGENLIKFN